MNPGRMLAANRSFYEENADRYASRVAKADTGSACRVFAALIPAGGRVLDAGCGPGYDARAFRRLGLRVAGFDVSPRMVDRTRRLGVDARVDSFQGFRAGCQYDAVWASASLLHVPRSQIRSVLGRLADSLRPGGVIYISLWEGHGEVRLGDGRHVSLYYLPEFKGILSSVPTVKVFHAWRFPRRRGDPNPAWIGFLARKAKGAAAVKGKCIT